MSESITAALREYINSHSFGTVTCWDGLIGHLPPDYKAICGKTRDIESILDDIDAEYAKAKSVAVDQALDQASDPVFEAHGYVHLPVDCDGETIHPGDRVVYGKETYVVREMSLQDGVWLINGLTGNRVNEYFFADNCRHAKLTAHITLSEDAIRLVLGGDQIEEKIAEYVRKLKERGHDEDD